MAAVEVVGKMLGHKNYRNGLTNPCDSSPLPAALLVPPSRELGAAELLGITRHALKRRIVKLGIEWPPARNIPSEP